MSAAEDRRSEQYFRLPLPPTSNHQYEPIWRRNTAGRVVHGKRKSDAYQTWRDEAALIVRGWEPPIKTPLGVTIDLFLPTRIGRRADISGFVKGIEDAVVGSRRDNWIDWELVRRWCADDNTGWADVWVMARPEPRINPEVPD